jgi:histidinol-phosphate/aromatic aminotransferase/cobyric acid decarboxylase-like protein
MLLETSFDPLDAIDDLCAKVASCKGLVIIDESNGNYWPASYSAARLVRRSSNLIVLRGFSKAYGLGGLRCGIALVSRELQTRISNIATPLQVSSLSIDIARRVMLHGDATRGLRTQILVRKAQMLEALSVSGVGGLTASHGYLPYVFAANAADMGARQLGQCGILGKPQPLWGSIGGHGAPFRLSAPLRDDRFARLKALLARNRHSLA